MFLSGVVWLGPGWLLELINHTKTICAKTIIKQNNKFKKWFDLALGL